MSLYVILFGVLVAASLLVFVAGLRGRVQVRAAEEARMYAVGTTLTLEEVELSRPFFERAIKPGFTQLLALLGRLTPQHNIEETAHKLEVAGRPNNWSPATFFGLRILFGVVCAILAFGLMLLSNTSVTIKLVLTAAFGLLGVYMPVLWLATRMAARKRAVLRALPDGLDMLNISVGAGLGFDAALSRVGERWHGALADEFSRVVAEIRLGRSRRQALLDLAERTELLEIETFVAAIVQADQLGVSIGKVLHAQAEQMRIMRRQRAEELARQASIKMLFPLVFLIFPALLAVLLGPAVPKILRTFNSLGQ